MRIAPAMFRRLAFLCLLATNWIGTTGCTGSSSTPELPVQQNQAVNEKAAPRGGVVQQPKDPATSVGRVEKASQLKSKRSAKKDNGPPRRDEGESEAFAAISHLIRKSVVFGPTLVVWFFDCSESALPLSKAVAADINELYEQLAEEGLAAQTTSGQPQLLTAILSFGKEATFVLEQPSGDRSEVSVALARIQLDESGQEVPFTAIKTALDKYVKYRLDDRREVLFLGVTNEAGDDGQLVDELLPALDKALIPVYVIGAPAPFGKQAALSQFVEGPTDLDAQANSPTVRHGPESREVEVIDTGLLGPGPSELLESGFGPFDWERLCRGSGGKFLRLNPSVDDSLFRFDNNQQWPSQGVARFDGLTAGYAPDYVSQARYQQLLGENKARAAIHKATQFKPLATSFSPRLSFEKKSEAELSRMLSEAQQAAAQLSPIVDQLYQTLQEGEGDRGRLTSLRWQAAYDLAMGRAAAAKAKVDGYNAMLAELKRKSDFKNPGSTQWVLEPAETLEAGSALQKLVDKARLYLNRVVKEHPGTPWAKIAAREAETPSGWKWAER